MYISDMSFLSISHTDDRVFMSDFWLEHSTEATVEMMMLDDTAEILTEKEVPEILDLLPQYTGKDVLELGAGIGYMISS